MCLSPHFAQRGDGDQCVDLRRGYRSVTEKFLHDAYVRAAVEQVCGKRVPERMG